MSNRIAKLWAATTLTAVFLVPLTGQTISRWGNGRFGNLELGFEAKVPETVIQSRPMGDKKLALVFAPMMAMPHSMPLSMIMPSYMVVGELLEEYPEFRDLTTEQVRDQLTKRSAKWAQEKGPLNASIMVAAGATANTVIVMWGVNKGIVLTGPKSAEVDESIRQILKSATIDGKSL